MLNNKFFYNRSYIIFFGLIIYYFITPLIFLFENSISKNDIFLSELNYISVTDKKSFIFYSFFTTLIIFFIFLYIKKILPTDNFEQNINKNFNFIFLILILVCIFFLIIDLYYLLNYYVENFPVNRSLLYYELLNKRNTHINILIIVSVANLNKHKIISLLSIFLLVLYSFISYSRIELILLFSILFCIFKIEKKNTIFFLLACSIILFIFVFYRFLLTSQSFIYIFVDPLHLSISSLNFLNNINFSDFNLLIKENLKFLLNDFFYFNFELKDFFRNDNLPTYSKRGIDTLILYLIPFLFYVIFLKYLNKNFFISNEFNSVIFIFLIISLFRGNFVHNIGFIIKLYIIILILECLTRIIKQLFLKVG